MPTLCAAYNLTNVVKLSEKHKVFRNRPDITISFVGMIDPFFSETLVYMERLRKAGGQVWFRAYPGCYHAFDFMVPKSQPAKNANAFLMDKFSFAVKHYFAPQPDNT